MSAFHVIKLYKCYQIAQSITNMKQMKKQLFSASHSL